MIIKTRVTTGIEPRTSTFPPSLPSSPSPYLNTPTRESRIVGKRQSHFQWRRDALRQLADPVVGLGKKGRREGGKKGRKGGGKSDSK
jgi:hypothetical protein